MRHIASRIESVADAQALAHRRLPKSLYQAIEGGAAKGVTQAANEQAFDAVTFRPRAGVWTSTVDTRTTVLGQQLALPVITAPTGNLRVFHKDGELGVARAVGQAGTAMCVGTLTGTAIEEVAAATSAPLIYQLYFLRDRATVEHAIARAKRAGCKALMLTLDAVSHVPRERPLTERALPVFEATSSLKNMLRFAPQTLASLPWMLDHLSDRSILDAPMGRPAHGLRPGLLRRRRPPRAEADLGGPGMDP